MTFGGPRQWELREYELPSGQRPIVDWLASFDGALKRRITNQILRLEEGNFSNVKAVGDGVAELRIDSGPGYRVYFGQEGQRLILLLTGGTKRRQQADIERAKQYFRNYLEEVRQSDAKSSISRNRTRSD